MTERNRWETAIRCLEIAVHPNTSDGEVLAAVAGFRRTANSASLTQLCRELAGADADGLRPPATPEGWKQTLDRLARENIALRQKIEAAEHSLAAALRQLHEAERRAREAGGELRAAEHRADAAEQQLAAARGVYGDVSSGLDRDGFDLQRSLNEARRDGAQPANGAAAPFQNVLKAALKGTDEAPRGAAAPNARHPWTA